MSHSARLTLYLFLLPVLLWLFLLIVIPHIELLLISLQAENLDGELEWSLINYQAFFDEKIYWMTFVRTALYAVLTTLLTFVITFPVAFYITKVLSLKYSVFLTILLVAGIIAVFLAWGTVAGHAVRIARSNPVLALRYE